MSYGVFRLNRCYVGPKVLIISAEEHAYFIREETGWYMRDDFGDETPVFSRDEKPAYTTSTKTMQHPKVFRHVSSCKLNMELSGVKGELQKKYIRMAVPMFLQSQPPQENYLLNPVPPMIRSVSF